MGSPDAYAYGVGQAAALARALGEPAITVLELGVAGGAGLLELEHLAASETRVNVHAVGFDRGTGMPAPVDYRDLPYVWRAGHYAMDETALRRRLTSAELRAGDVAGTLPRFLAEGPPPVGFIVFDLDYYSSTAAALAALATAPVGRFLPRVLCYFDDTVGPNEELHSEFTGELLAITEFNDASLRRKVAPVHGLGTKPGINGAQWAQGMHALHLFDHPRYCDYVHPEPDRQLPLTGGGRGPAVAMVTAIYGGYDQPRPTLPQYGGNVEWVLVTDDETIPDGHLGWRVVYEPRPGMAPMRASRPPKLRPWEYTDAPASVYMDASVWVTSPSLAADFLAAADPVSSFAHPDRDCLFDEAEVAAVQARYAAEPVAAQAVHYREAGHPEHWGLWENTIIGRHHTPEVIKMGEAWAAEVDAWSTHDQMSFPFVLRQAGLRAGVLPGRALGSPWHRWGGSARHLESSRTVAR